MSVALPTSNVSAERPRVDPRLPFAALLTLYAVAGFSVLGFNRTPLQMLAIVASGCALDAGLARLLDRRRLVPLSAYISCCSLAILLNYSHASWVLFLPVLLTIGSKYVFTFEGKHVFNPSMFGVATSLLLTSDLISAAPAYQWSGRALTVSAFLVMAALVLFVFRIGKSWLVVSFIAFYAAQTALRAWAMRHHLPPSVLFVGTISSPPFFLFTFYMLTDPATSPKTAKGQVGLAAAITVVDLWLHFLESVYTFFYAALIVGTAKLVFLHARAAWREGPRAYLAARLVPATARRVFGVGATAGAMFGAYGTVLAPYVRPDDPGFRLVAVPPERSGIVTEHGTLLEQVDPRVAHIAKWVLGVGDAVATGDVDGDGRVDLFLTNALKRDEDRAALYRNLGDFRFERVPLPELTARLADPKKNGAAAGGTLVDWDGDGDLDLAVAVGFGKSRLLANRLVETGTLAFEDVTEALGVDEHTVSLGITFLDADRDARLDMLVTNALQTHLPGYEKPTPFNFFDLPAPEFEGDRRMFSFMHDGWHDARNGGLNAFFEGMERGFEKRDAAALGMPETHWSIAVATGDLNRDGWTDLYLATDFGRDDLYLNEQGRRFRRIAGPMFGDVGKDTYKGMNSTIADVDGDGWLDVYVSNNHHALQSEGSLLWMTRPSRKDAFVPRFTDEATARGALNERRWGWGAAAGDLDNDGWIDLLQANGMVDDRHDAKGYRRKDYLYVNHKLMQSGPEVHTYADQWGDIRGRVIFPNEARRVLRNTGGGHFVDVARIVGAADPDNSRGVAFADFDDDGDLDVVVTNQHGPVSLYENRASHANGWIGVTLVGDGKRTHRSAIGSRVTVRAGDVERVREVSALNGFSGQSDSDRRVHVGLGTHRGPVEVTVDWLGAEPRTYTLESGRYHEVRQ